MNVNLSNRQVQGLKMSSTRNSVQNLNATVGNQKSSQMESEAKYRDKSIKSRGKSIYLGFIGYTQGQKDFAKKRRQYSQNNQSRSSSSSSKQIYYTKQLGRHQASKRPQKTDLTRGLSNGRNEMKLLQPGSPQKISSFDYVTPRKGDGYDKPEIQNDQFIQNVNLGRLGDGQTHYLKQDLKDQSPINSSQKKFQDQFNPLKKRSLSTISKKDQSQSQGQFNDYNVLKHTPLSSGIENPSMLFRSQSSLKGPPQNLPSNSKQVSDFNPNPVSWLQDPTAHKSRVRVVARFRPFNDIEKLLDKDSSSANMVTQDDFDKDSVVLKDNFQSSKGLKFKFDKVFTETASQLSIYDVCAKNVVRDALNGYNSTIMAYGQTGSGKTYTMFGPDILDTQSMGIIPRVSRDIFKAIKERYYMKESSPGLEESETEYQVKVQMVEIYKESFVDLLVHSPQVTDDHLELQKNLLPPPIELKLKENAAKGVFVEGLTSVNVISEEELTQVLQLGELNRHVGQTQQNQYSSRSHSILMIEIIQRFSNDSSKRGLINLVDLAGSERVSKSYAQGNALEEAKKINQSLSTLGQVIKAISKRSAHIPYRDSKLTRLLKESLGGNNKTTLIVNCSQHFSQYDETLSTLRFAQSAKMIENQVKVNVRHHNNEQSEVLQNIIKQLKNELNLTKLEMTRLKSTLTTPGNQSIILGQNPDEFDGPGDAPANNNLNKLVETLEAENLQLKRELQSYKDQQSKRQEQQSKNINQESLRIEELEFERNYQNLKIQNLEKDLQSHLKTISRLEHTLQCNIQETRSMGIERAKNFYSIQPILNRNLNMPSTIQQLFQPSQVAGKEGQLENQFQLFSDIQEIDSMSKTTGLNSKNPLTVDLLIHQILMLTLKNQEQDRKLILTENKVKNDSLQIQLMDNQINDLLQFQNSRKNIIDKLLRVDKDKLIIDQALQKIDTAIQSVKGTPQMESPFLTRVNSPRRPQFVRSILKQSSGNHMGRIDTEPDIQNPTFGKKPSLVQRRTINLPQQNIFSNNQVLIKENNDNSKDDSFVDDMGSVGDGESFCITHGPEFTDGIRVNTISNFDFGVKITNNNTSQVTNILATEYQGTASNLNLKTEQDEAVHLKTDSPLQLKEEPLQNQESPSTDRALLLQIYEMLTKIKEIQSEKIGIINQQNQELQAHLNQMQFQQIRKYQQQIQDCEQKYTKIVGNLEVRFYKDISAVKTWVSQIMKTVKQRVGIVVEKIAIEKVNSQFDKEKSTSSKGRISKKERKMKFRAKSIGNQSIDESKYHSPNQFQSNPMNVYKSHYYNRVQGNERDSSIHSPVDLINYSLIKKGEDERVDTCVNDSRNNYFTTSRILNTQGTPERNDKKQDAQKHKSSFSRNRSISKNSDEHGLSHKDSISDILSTGNQPVKRQVDFIQTLKKTKPIAKVPYQIPNGASRESKRDSSPSYGSDASSPFKNQTNSSFKNQTLETDKSVSTIQPKPVKQRPSIPISKKRQSLKFESNPKNHNQSLSKLRNLSARRSSQNLNATTPSKTQLKKTPQKSKLLQKSSLEESKGDEKIKFKLLSRNKNIMSQSQNMFSKLSDFQNKSEVAEKNQMNLTQKSNKIKIIKQKK